MNLPTNYWEKAFQIPTYIKLNYWINQYISKKKTIKKLILFYASPTTFQVSTCWYHL